MTWLTNYYRYSYGEKMKKLIIFGNTDEAQLAHYYFTTDSQYKVVAFTVESNYCDGSTLLGLPVINFDGILETFGPADHDIFVAIGYSNLNSLRKRIYEKCKAIGYSLPSYISSRATILNEGHIGDNCFILEDNTIQPYVKIGNNITLWSGNHIGHHSNIGDHTFIASHAVISGRVNIGEQCFIGVNATIRDNIQVADKCVIGAGALILKDADADGVYIGNQTIRSRVHSSRLRLI